MRDPHAHVIGTVNLVADLAPPVAMNTDRFVATTGARRLKSNTLAIVEGTLAVLAGLSWPAAAFD